MDGQSPMPLNPPVKLKKWKKAKRKPSVSAPNARITEATIPEAEVSTQEARTPDVVTHEVDASTQSDVGALIGIGVAILFIVAVTWGIVHFANQPSAAERRAAIRVALTYDHEIAGVMELCEILNLGLSDEPKRKYIEKLRLIPLANCPTTFVEAYQEHISAWERYDKAEIKRTFRLVQQISRENGVEPP